MKYLILIMLVVLVGCSSIQLATLTEVCYSDADGVMDSRVFVSYRMEGKSLIGITVDYKEITIYDAKIKSIEKTTIVKNY